MNAQQTSLDSCSVMLIDEQPQEAGAFIEVNEMNAPFPVRRVFFIQDVPPHESRGGHAHKTCHELLVAPKGRVTVTLDDGERRADFQLDHPSKALHIPPGIWIAHVVFSEGAICLALTSHAYNEDDYHRSYAGFCDWKLELPAP